MSDDDRQADGQTRSRGPGVTDTKAERRAARALIGPYDEARFSDLIDQIRGALAHCDAGEMDTFDLDDVIHHYKRSARELWKFCSGTGSDALFAARTLEYWQAAGEPPDWREAGAPRHRRCATDADSCEGRHAVSFVC
jgi:hypothetical protein